MVEENLFENFCLAINLLEDDEKELFFFLTNKFLKISDIDYFPKIKYVIEHIELPENIKNIIVVPLTNFADSSKVKSSSSLVYYVKNQLRKKFTGCSVQAYNHYQDISKPITEDTVLFFPDDFIGSGTYATGFLMELQDKFGTTNNLFITIAILKTGKEQLESLNSSVYSYYVLEKGILDDKTIDTKRKQRYYDILHKLSQKLGVYASFEKGMYESEALVSLIKIPNNTFGLYWCESKQTKEKKWPQLFQRR